MFRIRGILGNRPGALANLLGTGDPPFLAHGFYLHPGSAAFYGVILNAEQLHGNIASIKHRFNGGEVEDDVFEVIDDEGIDPTLLQQEAFSIQISPSPFEGGWVDVGISKLECYRRQYNDRDTRSVKNLS